MIKIIDILLRKTIKKKSYEKENFESDIQHRGEKHEKETFYLIYRESQWEGLMSYVNNFLWFIDYAVRKKYIPVVDMMNWRNSYLEDGELGKINSYEKFFLQPGGCNVFELNDAKNIISNKGQPSPDNYLKRGSCIVKRKWRKAFQNYIKVNPEILKLIDQEYKKIICDNDKGKILGINIRGTDYVRLQCSGLPKQPEVNEVILKAKEWYQKYNCKRIFVCCDSEEVVQKVRQSFAEGVVVTNERMYYPAGDDKHTSNPMITFDRPHDAYYKGLEYLTSIVILARCDYLLGGMSGAAVSAQLMKPLKNDYKRIYIWNLGKYE